MLSWSPSPHRNEDDCGGTLVDITCNSFVHSHHTDSDLDHVTCFGQQDISKQDTSRVLVFVHKDYLIFN